MRMQAKVTGDLERIMASESAAGAAAVTQGLREAGEALKKQFRADVASAGLGSKLANAIRNITYPLSGSSLGAAALVYARPSKTAANGGAAGILATFEEGATIRAKKGKYLVIPTAAVPKGRGGAPMAIADFIAKYGKEKISFIKARNGRIYVVGRIGRVKSTGRLTRRKMKNVDATLFYILVSVVQLRKRLDWQGKGLAMANSVADRIVTLWEQSNAIQA